MKARKNNSLGFAGTRSTLPEDWDKMDLNCFMTLTRNMDPDSTGFICWRSMLTYFILLQSPVPTDTETS